MGEAPSWSIVQFFDDYEVQLMMLLSFALQLFLFFFGGLRRRSRHLLLRIPLWLAYLSADSIAVYVLGYLSRHLPDTPDTDKICQAKCGQTHVQLTPLWAPFLLIHLGGQDTITAFSIEDNELWLRHLLNLLVQACLVVYVLCKSVAHNGRLVVPAVFAFVSGIIKYGERVWALKCGSQKGLRSDIKRRTADQNGAELRYSTIVKYALLSERGIRFLFTGREILSMGINIVICQFFEGVLNRGQPSRMLHALRAFKVLEIEVSIMYDSLFTKASVLQTKRLGTILRCVSLTSTTVSFMVFIVMSTKRTSNYTRADVAITYALFIGALCLEACAIFMLFISPRTWAFMEDGGGVCKMLARVAWSIFVRIQPDTKPWWSNTMGQYNLLSSLLPDKSSMMSTVMAKMMNMVGASEFWNNIRHSRVAKVDIRIMEIINQTTLDLAESPGLQSGPDHPVDQFKTVLEHRFEKTLLILHLFTDLVLHKAVKSVAGTGSGITQDLQRLIDTCKGVSDYMLYLLLVHPAMLPVSGSVFDILSDASHDITKGVHSGNVDPGDYSNGKEKFLEELSLIDHVDIYPLSANGLRALKLKMEEKGPLVALETLQQVWVRLLVYAAGKSRPEEHARQLSMGGELLTFVWLLMAHRRLGDLRSFPVDLMPTAGPMGEEASQGGGRGATITHKFLFDI